MEARIDAKAAILWPPDAKSQLIGKDRDAVKDWRQEEKGMTEDEMSGWHYWLNGLEFEQTLGEAWHSIVHGVVKSWTQLSNWKTREAREPKSLVYSHCRVHHYLHLLLTSRNESCCHHFKMNSKLSPCFIFLTQGPKF